MPDVWFPGARRDTSRNWTHWTMDKSTPSRRAVWHTTENGQSARLDGIASYMYNSAGKGTGYTILVHPSTGDVLQLRPINVGAGSLRTTSGVPSYNKTGTVTCQVSVCGYASERWWEKYSCPWMDDIITWFREWGITDQYVYSSSTGPKMSQAQWRSNKSGHCFHRTVPNQTHTDPGPVPAPWSLAGGAPWIPPGQGQEEWDRNPLFHRNLYLKTPMRKGEDVRWVQAELNKRGYSAGAEDGYFGNNTDKAVRAFQKKAGLTSDGNLGSSSATALNMPGSPGFVSPVNPPAPTPPPPSSSPIKVVVPVQGGGSVSLRLLKRTSPMTNGRDVRSVQTLLNSHGNSVGAVDGVFGERTKSAVRAFQSKKKLAVDGIVGARTWERLLNG